VPELGKFEHFLDLIDQAHEAEFPQPATLVLEVDTDGGVAVVAQPASNAEREPAKVVPYLFEALSCYGVLEDENWSARLEGGLLAPDQVAQVRRTIYEELLWLADDLLRRKVDHGRRTAEGSGHRSLGSSALRGGSCITQAGIGRCGQSPTSGRTASSVKGKVLRPTACRSGFARSAFSPPRSG
jgi:hypothetical protein